MSASESPLVCPNCHATVPLAEAGRREPLGDLDPKKWQMVYCPHCGHRIKTILVIDE